MNKRVADEIKSKGPGQMFLWCVVAIVVPAIVFWYVPWYYALITLATASSFSTLVANPKYYNFIEEKTGYGSLERKLLTCPKCLAFWITVGILSIILLTVPQKIDVYYLIANALYPFISSAYAFIFFAVLSIIKGQSPLTCCGKDANNMK